jgi:hypothetical protein
VPDFDAAGDVDHFKARHDRMPFADAFSDALALRDAPDLGHAVTSRDVIWSSTRSSRHRTAFHADAAGHDRVSCKSRARRATSVRFFIYEHDWL